MKQFLQNFIKLKQKEVKKPTIISSLAPKILTKKEDIEKIKPYLDKLNETINTDGINNIALTGGYGSGKSTIIKTFKHLNPQYEYLNISLASFNKKSDKKLTPSENKIQKEELERLLEVSILQQIFYHVKPSEIPESRFKRIVNISNKKMLGISIALIIWLLSLILLFKYDYIDKINPNIWDTKNEFDWGALIIFLFFFSGLGLLSKQIVTLFSNSKINKVNIKGELELGDNISKSVFNEHLEEILYFFEKTKFNVVIIEDLDRFDSTDIFTKLREINILLNNSKLIEQEISFVYAVGDDLFDDKKERVKFFEYIIPVIPFINSSNADEQLTTLIKESGLNEDIFTKEFMSDVTTFIDDIDMRLLTNIFHEFVIYRKTLNPEFIKKNDELFAMITYKNIDPKDFTLINRKEGKLYELINNKKIYIEKWIHKMDEEIQKKSSEIKRIENETITDVKELRAIYLNKVLCKLPTNTTLSDLNILELLEDNGFEKILSRNVVYNVYHQYSGHLYSQSSDQKLKYNFNDIENEINPDYTYAERVILIKSKHNNKIDLLKNEIEKLRREKSDIEQWDLKQIFNEVDVNQYLDDFSNNKLLRNLILNGYINENYNDYISLFHEVSITKEDFTFERNVKSGYVTEFNYKLSDKIENLIDRIDERYFGRETILNFDLLDYLGNNYNRYSNKYDAIIRLLSNEKERSIDFISKYTEEVKPPIWIFMEKLVENWKGFLDFIYLNSAYRSVENKYLELIIRFSKVETIINNQNTETLANIIEDTPYFLALIKNTDSLDYYGKITTLLNELNVKFEKLDNPNEDSDKLFNYVYNNNLYKINKNNVLQMLLIFAKEDTVKDFEHSNYSTILKSDCKPLIDYINSNIASYVENIYLKLEKNKLEEEETLVKLLNFNNDHLDHKLKIEIIQHIDTKISDIAKINQFEIKTQLLINNKVVPIWNNVINYYTECKNEINESLVDYLNFEDVYLGLSEEKMQRESDTFDYVEFREKLLLTDQLSDECYSKILESSIYTRNYLAFENLDEKKIEYLTKNILSTTKENYNLLREHFPNNHIKLVEKDFNKLLEKLDDFETDDDDVLMILQSLDITIDNRFNYIGKLEQSIIIENKEISKIVGNIILIKSTKVAFEYITIESLVKSSTLSEYKVKLIILYSKDLGNSELVKIVSLVGWSYAEMFKKQHRPTLDINDHNNKILKILREKALIKSYNTDKKDSSLYRIVANY